MEKIDISFLGQPVRKKGSQLFFNCPFHEDDNGHLGVNVAKGVYHCFKCNSSGKIKELEAPLTDFKKKVEDFLYGRPEEKEGQKVLVTLPEDYQKIHSGSGLPYRYLRDRGISEDEIRKYKMGYCSSGFFAERIIIPIYMENILKYFVGRTYTNRAPKYLNTPVPKDSTIFKTFSGRVDKAIICEGVFDAISIGRVFPAISILGKVLNGSQQIMSIVGATRQAFVMLDSDAEKDGFLAASLLNYYIPTQVMFIKAKDPGSMTPKEIRKMLPI